MEVRPHAGFFNTTPNIYSIQNNNIIKKTNKKKRKHEKKIVVKEPLLNASTKKILEESSHINLDPDQSILY